jgi:hypothetical protein
VGWAIALPLLATCARHWQRGTDPVATNTNGAHA